MPIEIKELNIKINLADSGGGNTTEGSDDANEAQEKLIETVVEKVLEIIRSKDER
ncbi:MAG: hypothetical protein JNL70_16895 [Saprospiraceae bacterium]|nr:hypothetical protein [Saprospiraceae bacterium]